MAFIPASESAARRKALMQNEMLESASSNIVSGLKGIAAADIEQRKQALLAQEKQQDRIDRANAAEGLANEKFNLGMRKEEFDREKLNVETKLKEDKLKQDAEIAGLNRAARIEAARIGAGTKQENRQIKATEKAQELNIPGYELSGESRPASNEVKDLRTKEASRLAITKTAKELSDAFGNSGYLGRATGLGQNARDIDRLMTDLKLQAKEAANLGALSGPDMGLVEDLVGKFTGPFDALKNKSEAMKAAKDVSDILSRKVQFELGTRGYSPKGTVAPKSQADIKNMTDAELEAFINGN